MFHHSHEISLIRHTTLRLIGCLLLLGLVSQLGIAQTSPDYASQGYASWYGPGFHNRLTANGEVFDAWEMTAAHLTLPFDTRVIVTNLDNGKQVLVRINDRGPYINNRIIDLSQGAAEELGMLRRGVAPVRVEVLEVREVNASEQDNQQALADAQASAQDIDRASYQTTMVEHLEGYSVASSEHQAGELLLLRSDAYDALIIVRVAEQMTLEGSDLLVSDLLYQKLGGQVYVVTETN
jgi:rare lipoprotein A